MAQINPANHRSGGQMPEIFRSQFHGRCDSGKIDNPKADGKQNQQMGLSDEKAKQGSIIHDDEQKNNGQGPYSVEKGKDPSAIPPICKEPGYDCAENIEAGQQTDSGSGNARRKSAILGKGNKMGIHQACSGDAAHEKREHEKQEFFSL